MQLKLELYTSEQQWKKSETSINRLLLTLINIIEEKLCESIMRKWNIDMQGKGERGVLRKVEVVKGYTLPKYKLPKVPFPAFTFNRSYL